VQLVYKIGICKGRRQERAIVVQVGFARRARKGSGSSIKVAL